MRPETVSSRPSSPTIGGITGYVLVSVAGYGGFDFGLPFSVTGDRAGAMQKVERLGGGDFGDDARRYAANRASEGDSNPVIRVPTPTQRSG
jgi:hypothetical protein